MKSIFDLICPEDIMTHALPEADENQPEEEQTLILANKTICTGDGKSVTANVEYNFEKDIMVLIIAVTDGTYNIDIHQVAIETPFVNGYLREE